MLTHCKPTMVQIQAKIPLVKNFCGCTSLENGTVFILWFSMIIGIVVMFLPHGTMKINGASPPPEFWDSLSKTQNSWNQVVGALGNSQISNVIPEIKNPGQIEGEIEVGNSWINFPFGLITVFVSGLALYGIFEENNGKYLFPYLSWCITCMVIMLVSLLFSPFGMVIFFFLIAVIYLGLFVYSMIVVYSFYHSLNMKSPGRYHRVQTEA